MAEGRCPRKLTQNKLELGLSPGDELFPGYGSNFEDGRVSNNIYFTVTLDAAIWGAELAKGKEPGRIYVVEPTGPFEDDPNLTNKRFPGNPTKSYRSRVPLRVVSEVKDWAGHPPDVLQAMRDHLAELERQGLAIIED
ncbi:NAD(+)--rifampin ADP-ribosyltransferase [Leptolyngbya sp. KIOST-1]|uniref:NAD(+)--rifampin ADP-ribosyltransferase n=1 Tax=Leptolyngbya sp. KIOST-1 TaxID=1229172 RepID=UPI00068B5349|nr:NAD(+)--rifampin ADP-ribosyltransferase [Leptolyngbya sp. KIOST-1]